MLKVLLTIDTELWPRNGAWPEQSYRGSSKELDEAYRRDILGRTEDGDYGLPYLLSSLQQNDLHGVFFVESLSSSVIGDRWLRSMVGAILAAHQEVQLHLHTEWLSEIDIAGHSLQYRQNLGDYTLEEQTAIVRHGLRNLRDAGALGVSALRAGNMGGDQNTPSAALAAGLKLDMSFDPARGAGVRSMLESLRDTTKNARACPTVPVSFVEDYRGHYRAAQLTALSFQELRQALVSAHRENWPCFVILLHSFELVCPFASLGAPLRRHWVNLRRWNKLLAFLSQNRDQFSTIGCADVGDDAHCGPVQKVHRTRKLDTMWRMGEQLISRLV